MLKDIRTIDLTPATSNVFYHYHFIHETLVYEESIMRQINHIKKILELSLSYHCPLRLFHITQRKKIDCNEHQKIVFVQQEVLNKETIGCGVSPLVALRCRTVYMHHVCMETWSADHKEGKRKHEETCKCVNVEAQSEIQQNNSSHLLCIQATRCARLKHKH